MTTADYNILTKSVMHLYMYNIWKSLSSVINVTIHVYHVYCIYLYIL